MTKGKVLRAILSALCVLIAALLCASAVGIYREGAAQKMEHPLEAIYTPETVAEKLVPVAPLLFIALALTAAGLLTGAKGKEKPADDAEIRRNLLASGVVRPSEAMKRERKRQTRVSFLGWAGFAACMIPILLYLLDGEHFPDGNLEPMIAALAAVLLPWTAAGIVCLTASAFLREKSLGREAEAAKEQRKAEKEAGIAPAVRKEKPAERRAPLQMAVCIAAIALIALGILNGGALDVLIKAINICTECIGLG